MQYCIKYDGKGRLRVRCGQFAFSEKEGYGIAQMLKEEKYILDVISSHQNGGLLITYADGARQQVLEKIKAIEKAHIKPVEPSDEDLSRKTDSAFQQSLVCIAVRHGLTKWLLPAPIRTAITLFKSVKYLKAGILSLLDMKLNVSVLDGVAIGASLCQRYFDTASSIMFLLSISDLLEDYIKKRTKDALTRSLAIDIDKVWLVKEESDILVPLASIRQGDCIKIRTGSMIPVDGVIIEGEAMINEASMTGEPLAVRKAEGAFVYAGTVIEEGCAVINVKAVNNETRINKIVKMIDQSEALKAEVQGKAEKLADSIVPFSFATALATYLVTRNMTKALSVLMVDYSCAIKLSTPISVISAMREASCHQIMVKGGKYLEAFAQADTIVFDKTGTLTEACPRVAKVIGCNGFTRKGVLRIAACLEEHFPHSVAKAIVKQAQSEGLNHEEEHTEVEYVVAHGIASMIHGQKALIGSEHFIFEDEKIPFSEEEKRIVEENRNGCSIIYLAIGGKLAGFIGIDDPARKEAKKMIADMKKEGVKHIIMLTGDSQNAAEAVSKALGITEYRSQVLPEEKANIIEELKKEGKKVIMVGDGVNDSPALSVADVSVAMKDASDIAREVADVTLLSGNLEELVILRRLSKLLMHRISWNYKFILTFNTSLLLLGLAGVITPATSAFCHNVSTMAISAASMRPCLK